MSTQELASNDADPITVEYTAAYEVEGERAFTRAAVVVRGRARALEVYDEITAAGHSPVLDRASFEEALSGQSSGGGQPAGEEEAS